MFGTKLEFSKYFFDEFVSEWQFYFKSAWSYMVFSYAA